MREVLIIERKLTRLLQDLGESVEPAGRLLHRAAALVAFARRTGVPQAVALTLRGQAEVLLRMDRFGEAADLLQQAVDQRVEGESSPLTLALMARLAEAHGRSEAWPAVMRVVRNGIPLVESARTGIGHPYAQSTFLRSSIDLYRWGVRAAYETRAHDDLLTWTELSKCRSAWRYQRRPARSCEIDAARAELRDLTDALHSASDSRDRRHLQERRQDLWEWLHSRRHPRSLPPPPRQPLRALQRALDPDDAAISYYWLGTDQLLIAAFDRSHFAVTVRPAGAWRTELQHYAAAVAGASSGNLDLAIEEVPDFSGWLLPRAFRSILSGKRRLYVSPHGLLHAVPFHALLWQQRAIVEAFAVRYAPNLLSIVPSWAAEEEGPVLVVGSTTYASRPALPAAELECERVAERYGRGRPVTLIRGRRANRATVAGLDRQDALSRYRCLHFAVHGQNVDSDRPMDSTLALYDSEVDGVELSNWHLQAELVVLSACSSGQRPIYTRGTQETLPGDDLFGLQAAFFAAGARQLVSALWPVRDRAGATIMATFHRWLEGDFTRPEFALQRAMLEYRGAERRPIADWAPFFVTGLGRPTHDTAEAGEEDEWTAQH